MTVQDAHTLKNGTKRINDWIDMHLISFINKKGEITYSEAAHIIDYLESKESPRRLARMGVLQAVAASKQWTARINKRNSKRIAEKLDTDVELVETFKNYYWVSLKTQESYNREGALMGHCVSSYFNKESKIYSLRDEENLPHCTIEVNKNTVTQIKGKENKSVVEKYHPHVIDFVNKLKLKVRYYDLEHINAYSVIRNGEEIICKAKDIVESDTISSDLKITKLEDVDFFPKKLLFNKLRLHFNLNVTKERVLVSLPKGWKFSLLDLFNCELNFDRVLNAREIYVTNSSLKAKKVNCTNLKLDDKSLIETPEINCKIFRCINSSINSIVINGEDLNADGSDFIHKKSKLNLDYATFTNMKDFATFNEVFKNAKIKSCLELVGNYSKNLVFPPLKLVSLNLIHSNVLELPDHVSSDKLFARSGIAFNAKNVSRYIVGGK